MDDGSVIMICFLLSPSLLMCHLHGSVVPRAWQQRGQGTGASMDIRAPNIFQHTPPEGSPLPACDQPSPSFTGHVWGQRAGASLTRQQRVRCSQVPRVSILLFRTCSLKHRLVALASQAETRLIQDLSPPHRDPGSGQVSTAPHFATEEEGALWG